MYLLQVLDNLKTLFKGKYLATLRARAKTKIENERKGKAQDVNRLEMQG